MSSQYFHRVVSIFLTTSDMCECGCRRCQTEKRGSFVWIVPCGRCPPLVLTGLLRSPVGDRGAHGSNAPLWCVPAVCMLLPRGFRAGPATAAGPSRSCRRACSRAARRVAAEALRLGGQRSLGFPGRVPVRVVGRAPGGALVLRAALHRPPVSLAACPVRRGHLGRPR
jgi:hypothetical protein